MYCAIGVFGEKKKKTLEGASNAPSVSPDRPPVDRLFSLQSGYKRAIDTYLRVITKYSTFERLLSILLTSLKLCRCSNPFSLKTDDTEVTNPIERVVIYKFSQSFFSL